MSTGSSIISRVFHELRVKALPSFTRPFMHETIRQ